MEIIITEEMRFRQRAVEYDGVKFLLTGYDYIQCFFY